MWEPLVNNPWIFWLIVMLALAAIEMLTLDFLFLMMSLAALVTTVVSLVVDSFTLQVVLFAVVSVLLIFLIRPLALRRLNRSTPTTRSNAERLVELPCTVLEPVGRHSGLVRLEGDIWTARADTEPPLAEGSSVFVERIDGATAVVSATAPATVAPEGPGRGVHP
ncbi:MULTISPECIES: NfeD family protein [unclassified Kocuria]|uniref:NfeD family protein n=1 Tax=unclassified Kocuria TaxID=2649579 RepID=UPI000F888D6B|nr:MULTISPECIES: NfeD family protein [unclassified Kocuria]RUP83151.1 NfeD family protein [Kocuria sp. HSID17590]RUQ07138.1 NfeD family protein [Kocuria sp. HSID17582]